MIQTRWQVCDPASYNEVFGGTLLKQVRITHSAVAIVVGVVLLSIVAFGMGLFAMLPGKDRTRQFCWSGGSFVAAIVLYWFAVIPVYWFAEFDTHSMIWAVFEAPQKIKAALPCPTGLFDDAVRDNGLVKNKANGEKNGSQQK